MNVASCWGVEAPTLILKVLKDFRWDFLKKSDNVLEGDDVEVLGKVAFRCTNDLVVVDSDSVAS